MKKSQNFKPRLVLDKETIAQLQQIQLANLKGGGAAQPTQPSSCLRHTCHGTGVTDQGSKTY